MQPGSANFYSSQNGPNNRKTSIIEGFHDTASKLNKLSKKKSAKELSDISDSEEEYKKPKKSKLRKIKNIFKKKKRDVINEEKKNSVQKIY